MFNKLKVVSAIFLLAASTNAVQASNTYVTSGPTLQTIQITNLLANKDLPNPGMTETAVMVSFFNGGKQFCWQQRIDYQNDASIHAASGLGCGTKINQVMIEPIAPRGNAANYVPLTLNIDTTKFATQVLILQDQAPVFDPQTGTVKIPGTIKVRTQMQYH